MKNPVESDFVLFFSYYQLFGDAYDLFTHIIQSYFTGNRAIISLFLLWREQMETFSALLALFAGNSPVTGEFPSQRPVTRSFDVFFDLRLNKRVSKQSWCW